MTEHAGVVVVGGSVAGLRTAEALRRFSYSGAVTIVEASNDLPYDRTALSKKVLAPDGDATQVGLRSQAQLDALNIDVRLQCQVEALDTAQRTLCLADGRAIGYSTLVIATGSDARSLPDVPHSAAHYLRTLSDARRLRCSMDSAQSAVIVGAGFIGSEVAAAMSTRGINVTVVEPAGDPLGRVLGNVIAARLAQLHERHGVHLLPGRAVNGVYPVATGANPYRVALDDGASLGADVVVVGVGARPNTAWLNRSAIEVADGVICNEFCQASVANVFAVGDVARWTNPLFEESMRVEHWTNAIEQAAIVAWNIANPDRMRTYASVPYVWSDQYSQRLQIVGRPRPDDELCIVEDDPADARLVALYARQGRLTGAFTLNAPNRAMALRRSLAAHASLDQALRVGA